MKRVRHTTGSLLLLGLLVCCCLASLGGQELLIVDVIEFYPFLGRGADGQGTGVVDETLRDLDHLLPAYQFVYENKPFVRIWDQLKQGEPNLYPTALKTAEREQFCIFSSPYMILPSNGLLVAGEATAPGESPGLGIDLAAALGDPDFRLAVTVGRKYGAAVDEALAKASPSQLLVVADFTREIPRLLRLLAQGKLGGIVGYEAEFIPAISGRAESERGFRFVNIVGMDRYTLGYMVVPRTEWGRQVMGTIDPVLKELRKKTALGLARHMLPAGTARYLEDSRRILGWQ